MSKPRQKALNSAKKGETSSSEGSLEVATPSKRHRESSAETERDESPLRKKIVSSTPLVSRDPAKLPRQRYSSFSSKESSPPSKIIPKEEFERDDYDDDESPTKSKPTKVVPPEEEEAVPPRQKGRTRASPQKRPPKKVIPPTKEEEEPSQKQPRPRLPLKLPKKSAPVKEEPQSPLKQVSEERSQDDITVEKTGRWRHHPSKVVPPAEKEMPASPRKQSTSPKKPAVSPKTPSAAKASQSKMSKGEQTQLDKTRNKSHRKASAPRKRSRVLKEIVHFQRSTRLLIPRLPFSRVVRDILQACGLHDMRVTKEALMALHEAAEVHLISVLEGGYEVALHARRKTLLQRDICFFVSLANRYFGRNY